MRPEDDSASPAVPNQYDEPAGRASRPSDRLARRRQALASIRQPTTDSGQAIVALTSPLALGTHLYDKAVVTGTIAGGNPTGTVSFYLCNPSQVTGTAGNEVCPTSVTGNQVEQNGVFCSVRRIGHFTGCLPRRRALTPGFSRVRIPVSFKDLRVTGQQLGVARGRHYCLGINLPGGRRITGVFIFVSAVDGLVCRESVDQQKE